SRIMSCAVAAQADRLRKSATALKVRIMASLLIDNPEMSRKACDVDCAARRLVQPARWHASIPVAGPRAAGRKLAAGHGAELKIIECVCVDEAIHRRR